MPIYEYQCQACDHKFEIIQKMSDEPLQDCPQCHQPQLKKLVSAAGFRLKGSGWYASDFKNSGKTSDNTANTNSATSANANSGGGCCGSSCGCGG